MYGKGVLPTSDKYYIYALCRPNGVPFYIGKGKGRRINDHFSKHQLKVNTPKTGKIKHYKSSVRREILCYFEDEYEAYKYEAWIISQYKLEKDGGVLVNYNKSHWDVCEKVQKRKSVYLTNEKPRKVSDEDLVSAHKVWVKGLKNTTELAEELGISTSYIQAVFSGAKRKNLGLDTQNNSFTKRRVCVETAKEVLRLRIIEKMSYWSIVDKTGIPKTTVSRICRFEGQYAAFKDLIPTTSQTNKGIIING